MTNHSQHFTEREKLITPGTRQGCPLSLFLFSIVLEVLARAIRQEKENEGNQKIESNYHCSEVGMITCYLENPKDSTNGQLRFD